MKMRASYWVAKYVDDPFRNEPRNVGVIVSLGEDIAARFVGEREDGTYDGRRVGARFRYANVYGQWRDFWRAKIHARSIDEIVKAKTPNYFIQSGGEVSNTGTDSVADICEFLYSFLVSSGGAAEAYGWPEHEVAEAALSAEIVTELSRFDLIGGAA